MKAVSIPGAPEPAMILLALSLACTGEPEPAGDSADGSSDGACGEPREHEVTLSVKVVDGLGGEALDGIELVLDDRGWTYDELGATSTGADGVGTLALSGVTDLPDCWGTVLDYVLEVSDPEGFYAGVEQGMNSALYNGIHEWGGEADMTAAPIELEPK